MFNLARNTQLVNFKLYTGEQEIVDENGYKTGSIVPQYGEMQSAYLSVSPNKGNADLQMFGTLEGYDRTMVTADITCQINENSILWVDGQNTEGPHNYFVRKRAPWKNSIAFAIKQVEVSNATSN